MDILNFFKKPNDYKKIKLKFQKISLTNNRLVKSKKYLDKLCKKYPQYCVRYKKVFFTVYKDVEVDEAIIIGEELVEHFPDDSTFLRVLSVRHKRVGNVQRAEELLKIIEKEEATKFNASKLVAVFDKYSSKEDLEKNIENLFSLYPNSRLDICKQSFVKLKDTYTKLAVKYGMEYGMDNPQDKEFFNVLQKRLERLDLNKDLEKLVKQREYYKYFNKLKEGEFFKDKKFSASKFAHELKIVSHKLPENLLERYIADVVEVFRSNSIDIYKIVFSILKDSHEKIALSYGKIYIEHTKDDKKFLKVWRDRKKQYDVIEKRAKKLARDKAYIEKIQQSKLYTSKTLAVKTFTKKLETISERLSTENLSIIIDSFLNKFPEQETKILETSFVILKDKHVELAARYGQQYIKHNPNNYKFAKVLIARLERLKMYDERIALAYEVLKHHEDNGLRYVVTHHEIKDALNKCEVLYSTDKRKLNRELKKLEKKFSKNKDMLYREIFKFYSKKEYSTAQKYAEKSLNEKYNEYVIKELYDLHMVNGAITEAVSVLPKESKIPILDVKRKNGSSLLDLYHNGFDLPVEKIKNYQPIKKKVFYILHNRLPYNSGGYATRSHGLLTGVSAFGWKMNGVSRLGYPQDKMPDMDSIPMDTVEGIDYHRLLDGEIGLGKLPLKEYLEAYAKALLQIALKEKPSIIHAASNYMNGIAANYVAKCLGIPYVYEVRGLWEITRISRQPEWKDTEYYDLMVKMETEAAKGADSLFTLTEALKDEMISRGVDGEKIHLLPNGVISDRFQPLEKNKDLAKELNVGNKTIIGFIGSFAQYEGIEYIVDAIELLVSRGRTNIVGLMVGDGAVWGDIVQRVKDKNLEDYFIFTGRIAHDKVEEYYSLVDIAPLPRKGLPVCEMVSPLKPFEAMAMEKVVLSSNVAALAEIVKHDYNGMLFEKDNVVDLADKIELLADDKELRNRLGKQAREWVVQERDWNIISKRLHNVYKEL